MRDLALILAHPRDTGAALVGQALADRFGAARVSVVAPERLGLARWSHHITCTGDVSTRIALPGGARIESHRVAVLLHRLAFVAPPSFRHASPKDADYATCELQALVASWIASLGDRVLGARTPHGIACDLRPNRTLLALARACGLDSIDPFITTRDGRGLPVEAPTPTHGRCRDRMLVIGGRVSGTLPFVGARCVELARRLGAPIVEVRFREHRGTAAVERLEFLPELDTSWAVEATTALVAGRLAEAS